VSGSRDAFERLHVLHAAIIITCRAADMEACEPAAASKM